MAICNAKLGAIILLISLPSLGYIGSTSACGVHYIFDETEPERCTPDSCRSNCNDYCWNLATCCCAYDRSRGCEFRLELGSGLRDEPCSRENDVCWRNCGGFCQDDLTCCCAPTFSNAADQNASNDDQNDEDGQPAGK